MKQRGRSRVVGVAEDPHHSAKRGALFPLRNSWWLPPLIGFAVVGLAFLAPRADNSIGLVLRDPDNYMRLAQIRDLLGGQSWWDVTQYRVNPPDGLKTHWSRLGDLPVAAVIGLLAPFLGPDTAERVAITAAPPLLLLATFLLLSRAAFNIGGIPAAACAAFVAATVPHLLAQFVPGRIDHHGLQVLLLAASLAAATGAETRRNGALAALPASASLVLGLEAAPYHLMIGLWLVGRWIRFGRPATPKMLGFAAGTALFLPMIVALTLAPPDWQRATSDAVGRGHISTVVVAGGMLALLASGRNSGAASRFTRAAVAAAAGAAMLVLFPEVLRSPYSDVGPVMQRLWLDHLSETRSFLDTWSSSPVAALKNVVLLLLAAIALLFLIRTQQGTDKYVLLGLLLLTGIVLTLYQFRGSAMASIPAILIAGAALGSLWQQWRQGGSLLALAAGLLLLNGAIGPALAQRVGTIGTENHRPAASGAGRCEERFSAAELNRLPRGLVVSPIDVSALVLVSSHHAVLTAPNHRNFEANREAYRAFLAPPDSARQALERLEVDYLLLCRTAETSRLAAFEPAGLASMIDQDRPPKWLNLLESQSDRELRVYAIE